MLAPKDFERFKVTRGSVKKKCDSVNVNVVRQITKQELDDPLLEGYDTWNAELFENQGQQCRAVNLKTGAFIPDKYHMFDNFCTQFGFW